MAEITSNDALTRLTKSERQALEAEIESEVHARLGPQLDRAEFVAHSTTVGERALAAALSLIRGAGRVITLLAAEALGSFAALMLMIVFVALENERVWAGALALGQSPQQAQLIALAVVVANAVVPVYELRNLSGRSTRIVVQMTARGYLVAFARRLFALPQAREVHVHHNPRLAVASAAITWSTLALALVAVLGPRLAQYADRAWYDALASLLHLDLAGALSLAGGALLSVGGVFFVQTAAFEVGVRVLVDMPADGAAKYEEYQRDRAAEVERIRSEVRARYMAAKIADRARQAAHAVDHPADGARADGGSVVPAFGPKPAGRGNGQIHSAG